ncbi:MAG: hypothetical protein V3V95_07660 [Thermodesulfobacteriota bacterium]
MGFGDILKDITRKKDIDKFTTKYLMTNRLIADLDDFGDCLTGDASDLFLDTLLKFMALAFKPNAIADVIFPGLKDFRRNISGFEGSYLFISKDEKICGAAVFEGGKMTAIKKVPKSERTIDYWDIIVKFRSSEAFRTFLFSRDQDILNLILTNDVEVEGNLNYLFRFGYFSKDLLYRTRLDRLLPG